VLVTAAGQQHSRRSCVQQTQDPDATCRGFRIGPAPVDASSSGSTEADPTGHEEGGSGDQGRGDGRDYEQRTSLSKWL